MSRPIVPLLMILAAVASLGGLAYPSVSTYATSTVLSTNVWTITKSGPLITTVTYFFTITNLKPTLTIEDCTPCYSGVGTQTLTQSKTLSSIVILESSVPFASRGVAGLVALLLAIILLLAGIGLLVIRRAKAKGNRKH